MLRVVTINTWHGFLLRGFAELVAIEPREQRAGRLDTLIRALRGLEPDVVCLQEVKPLDRLAPRMAEALDMDVLWALNNCGFRLGPWRLSGPLETGEGLAILARRHLGLTWSATRRLAGLRLATPSVAFQLGPCSTALAAEVTVAGRRLVIVDAHLRYTWPDEASLAATWAVLRRRGEVDGELPESVAKAHRPNIRARDGELDLLGRFLDRYLRAGLPVVLAADLNLDGDAAQLREMVRRRGGLDVLPAVAPGTPTWDPKVNPNAAYSTATRWPDDRDKSLGERLVAALDEKPQDPDHIILAGGLGEADLVDAGVALNEPVDGVWPSDHYAIKADLRL